MNRHRHASGQGLPGVPTPVGVSAIAGIRSQMALAAGVILAGMLAAGILIALALDSVEQRFESLTAQTTPAMEAVMGAALASAQVVSALPHLTTATDQYQRQNAQFSLAQRLSMLSSRLEGGAQLMGTPESLAALRDEVAALRVGVGQLNTVIYERIETAREIAQLSDVLRQQRAVLVSALPEGRDWTVSLTWVLTISRIDRLLARTEAPPRDAPATLSPWWLDATNDQTITVQETPLTVPMRQLIVLLERQADNGRLLTQLTDDMQIIAARLSVQTYQTIQRAQQRLAGDAVALSAQLDTVGRGLVVLALVVTVTMGLFSWLYVGRRLVARIMRLSEAARRLSQGDLSVIVRDQRRDELGVLARTMHLFRDAMAAKAEQAEELASRNVEIDRQNRELDRLSQMDELTGTYNRRHLTGLMSEIEADPRNALPLSLMMLDLDRFKRINDRFGHAAGDAALARFAQTCLALIRKSDIMARYGGEEFIILMPGSPLNRALLQAERLRRALEGVTVTSGPAQFGLTVSIGVAERGPTETMRELLHRADDALYGAKEGGRNRVEAAAA
jgi:diguanylate cyclase (GGDEF)-like protein